MPRYVSLKTENDFCNSIIEANHALIFTENTENGVVIKAKISDGSFVNVVDPRANTMKEGFETLTGESLASIAAGITSLANSKTAIRNAIAAKGQPCTSSTPLADYAGLISNISGGSRIYKCASVASGTWTGYLGTTDSTTGITTFASTTTSLTWSVKPFPEVGKIYTEDGINEVSVSETSRDNSVVFYAPLHDTQTNAVTGQLLTTSGTVDYSSGHAYFSGDGSGTGTAYISFPDTGFPSGSSSRTISFLAQPQQNNAYHIFRYGTYATATQAYRLGEGNTGENRFEVATTGGSDVNWYNMPSSGYHHYVVTYDGTNEELWIDGVSQGTQAHNVVNTVLAGTAYIAYGGSSPEYTGYISELKVWTRKITSAEITAEYNRLKAFIQ